MSTIKAPTLWQKLHTRVLFVKALYSSFVLLILGRGIKAKPAGKRFIYGLIRYLLDHATLEDDMVLSYPGTSGRYLEHAKKYNLTPDTINLDHGAKAHWLGPRDSERIICYFHGGGYAVAATPGQYKWLDRWRQNLSKTKSTSVVFLSYTLTPEAVYPVQIRQAVSLVNWLLTEGGKKPEQIIIGGDSAGANLTLAVLSHILHPHPEISPKLKPSGKFGGILLISPWVNFTKEDAIFVSNLENDIIGQHVGFRWGPNYRGGATQQDNYVEPVHAEAEWFRGIDGIVSKIWIWAGGAEVLLGSINDFTNQLKKDFPNLEYMVEENSIHTEMYIDASNLPMEDTAGTRQIEKWMSTV